MMQHKGYVARVEFDSDALLLHGEVSGIRDVVTFQARSVDELEQAFRDSVDDYLEFCKARGEEPDKPLSGKFMTRFSPSLHRQATTAAAAAGKSLNAWLVEQIQKAVSTGSSGGATRSSKTQGKARPGSGSRREVHSRLLAAAKKKRTVRKNQPRPQRSHRQIVLDD